MGHIYVPSTAMRPNNIRNLHDESLTHRSAQLLVVEFDPEISLYQLHKWRSAETNNDACCEGQRVKAYSKMSRPRGPDWKNVLGEAVHWRHVRKHWSQAFFYYVLDTSLPTNQQPRANASE